MYVRSRGLDVRVLYCVDFRFRVCEGQAYAYLNSSSKQHGYVKRTRGGERTKVSKEDKGQIQTRRGGGKRQTAKGLEAALRVVQIAARVN